MVNPHAVYLEHLLSQLKSNYTEDTRKFFTALAQKADKDILELLVKAILQQLKKGEGSGNRVQH